MNVVSRCAEMDISRSRDETAFLLLPVFEEKAPSLAVLEEWSRSRRGGGTSGDVPVSLPSLEIHIVSPSFICDGNGRGAC